jgi:hypothetical protein
MKIGEEKPLIEIIQEIANGHNKKDLKLRYEYGLTYRFYVDDFKMIAYNGTGLYIGKVLNDKFRLDGYFKKKLENPYED